MTSGAWRVTAGCAAAWALAACGGGPQPKPDLDLDDVAVVADAPEIGSDDDGPSDTSDDGEIGTDATPGSGADAFDVASDGQGEVGPGDGDTDGSCSEPCDDGDPCTHDSCGPGDQCVHAVDAGAACDDGDACTLEDACDASGACRGSALDCGTFADACHESSCVAGTCVTSSTVGVPCDDDDPCSGDDACDGSGTCTGVPLDCSGIEDGCHAAACIQGQCIQSVLVGKECDDQNACTVEDACSASGACLGTWNAADLGCGCTTAADCDDGLPCTLEDCLPDGTCEAAVAPGWCAVGGACYQEGQVSAESPCLTCLTAASQGALTPVACDDGDPCTVDTCAAGQCVHDLITCSPANACEDVACDGQGGCTASAKPGTCTIGGQCLQVGERDPVDPCLECAPDKSASAWSPAEGPCDDGVPCTTGDACVEGVCHGAPISCDDERSCTVDVCNPDGTCSHFPPAGACLIAGVCYAHGELDPGNACQWCQGGTSWTARPDGTTCSDASVCTTNDQCQAGQCTGDPIHCGGPDTQCSTTGCHALQGCYDQAKPKGTPCDDGDPCTIGDGCVPGGLCTGTPLDCSSLADACRTAACAGGTCQLTPKIGAPCDDGVACTTQDQCTPAGTCAGSWSYKAPGCGCAAAEQCDDGLACTTDVCLPTGECAHGVAAGRCLIDGACFEDGATKPGNLCLECVAGLSPTAFGVVACDDGNPCTDDQCDPSAGCVAQANDARACSDGDPCSSDDHCASGTCVGTCECKADADCEALVAAPACRRPACVGYRCSLVVDADQDGQPCSDANACTVGDTCVGGACVPAGPRSCPPAKDGCGVSGCDALVGCYSGQKPVGFACDDGDACTMNDTCTVWGCTGGVPADCSALDDACNAGACADGGCERVPKPGAPCTDGLACTDADQCTSSGTCQGHWDVEGCGCQGDADCEDGLACTTDTCAPNGACQSDVTAGWCVVDGACYAVGASKPGSLCWRCDPAVALNAFTPLACDDGNPCTLDACSAAVGCTASPVDGACSDGDDCSTDDHCEDGACVGSCACHVSADCAGDPGPCRRWACTSYACVSIADAAKNGAACDDGLFCTVGDACTYGACKGAAPRDCSAKASGQCIVGACSEAKDECQAQPAAQSTACEDGDPCTDGDHCASGVCAGAPRSCAGIGDACHVASCDSATGTCVTSVAAGAPCSDGDACTTGDVCSADGACSGTWSPSGCGCADDAGCATLNDACHTGRCDVATHTCHLQPQPGGGCNDGNPCTAADTCTATGACAGVTTPCDDGLSCTVDACDGSGGCTHGLATGSCLIEGTCYGPGQVNPANPCERCQGGEGWSCDDGKHCSDGDPCTAGDTCSGGTCGGARYDCLSPSLCESASCDGLGGCAVVLQAGSCKIGGACVAGGTADPTSPCRACVPATSPTSWSPALGPCNDGDACTTGDTCASGSCAGTPYSCDDGLPCTSDACDGGGGCSHKLVSGQCLIGGACWSAGVVDPANACQVCAGTTHWSPRPSGTTCDDGKACTTGDACDSAGHCNPGVDTCAVDPCDACDDGDLCTVELCSPGGSCESFAAGDAWCNDGNPCTQDVCDPDAGCQHEAAPAEAGCALGCCTGHDGGGCASDACTSCACKANAACCTGDWTDACAALAHGTCGASCGCGCGDGVCGAGEACDTCQADCGECTTQSALETAQCCLTNDTMGCPAGECRDCVCAIDPTCCTDAWTSACAALAASPFCGAVCGHCACGDGTCEPYETCTSCPADCGPCPTGCCAAGTTADQCPDAACVQCACTADASCCTSWGDTCVALAGDGCAAECGCGCGDGSCKAGAETCATCPADCGACAGECCTAHLTVGCGAPACQDCVCGYLPSCCDGGWDDACVLAAGLCGQLCDCE